MKLHTPSFEKALRRDVKKAVRSSPELKGEFKRANRFRRNRNVGFLLRPASGIILGLLVWNVTASTSHIETGLAVINLWMLGFLFFQQQGIWKRLYNSPDLVALLLLPITTERMFRWQFQKVIRYSFLTLSDLCFGFGALAYFCGFQPWKWVGSFVVVILSWMTLFAISLLCTARLPQKPFQIISSSMMFLGLILFFGRNIFGNLAIKILDQYAPAINILLPTGWPVSLFQILTADNQWWLLVLLIPVTLIVWTTKDSLQRLLKSFEYREHILAQPSDLIPGENFIKKPESDKPLQLGPTAIEEIIHSRRFLALPLWPEKGWFEQKLWHWLNDREKALSEFVYPTGFAITAPWIKTFRNLLGTAAIAYVAGLVNPTWKFCVLGLGLFITICQVLLQILNQGRAFQPWHCSGVNIPMYSVYGIGYSELSRVLFKSSIIQIPMLLAYMTVTGAIWAFLTDYPIFAGIVMGLKFGCLFFASRFIFVTLAFSSGTNDTSGFRFRAMLLIFLIILLGVLFLVLGGTGLFVPNQPVSWMLCALAMLDAFAFFWIYSWFYNSGRFDLMSLPRR